MSLPIRTLPYGLESKPQFLLDPNTGKGPPVTTIRCIKDQKTQLEKMRRIFELLQGVTNMPKVLNEMPDDNCILIITRIPSETTLADLLKQGNGLKAEELLQIMRQLLDLALRIHAVGCCNINFDPNNLAYDINSASLAIIDPRSIVKIGENQEDLVLESLRFMAPERLLGKQPSPSSDFWSLGTLFFELVTGTPFFPMTEMPKELSTATQVNQLLHMMGGIGRAPFTDDEDPKNMENYSSFHNSVSLDKWEEMKREGHKELSHSYPEPYNWMHSLLAELTRKIFTDYEKEQIVRIISFALKNSEERLTNMEIFSSYGFEYVIEMKIKNSGFNGRIEFSLEPDGPNGQREIFSTLYTGDLPLPDTIYFPPKIFNEEEIKEIIVTLLPDDQKGSVRRVFRKFQSYEGFCLSAHPDICRITHKKPPRELNFSPASSLEARMLMQKKLEGLRNQQDEPDPKRQKTE